MATTTEKTAPKTHFYELLKNFDTGMLVTRCDGMLRGRPMRVLHAAEHKGIWFASSSDSPKNAELVRDSVCNLTFQKNDMFMTVSGESEILKDKHLINEFWTEEMALWFPQGKDTENLTLIHIKPMQGEFWDFSGLLRKFNFAFEASKAWLFSEKHTAPSGENVKVDLKSPQPEPIQKHQQ